MVKIAPAVKYVPPPPKTPVTNLKAIVQNATAAEQASSKALTVTPGPVASKPGASVSSGAGSAGRCAAPVHAGQHGWQAA
jgi:hypothetical protein